MNNLPRQKLQELIVEYGLHLCDDPRRCEALLRDYCGQYRKEIFLLIGALREGLVSDLLKSSNSISWSVTSARLARRMEDHLGTSPDVAQWTIDAWAFALGISTNQDSNIGHSTTATSSPSSKQEEQTYIPSVSSEKQEADSQRLQVKAQETSEPEDYETRLRQYEQKFIREIQIEYPLSYAVQKVLERYQQYLKLKDEDIKRIEQSVIFQQVTHREKTDSKNKSAIGCQQQEDIEVESSSSNSDEAETYNKHGNARYQQGDFQGAIADYTKALAINPNLAKAYYNRANVRCEQGDFQGAIADYTKALQIKPNYTQAYHNRGHTRYQQGDIEGAITDYTDALKFDPNCSKAYNNRESAKSHRVFIT